MHGRGSWIESIALLVAGTLAAGLAASRTDSLPAERNPDQRAARVAEPVVSSLLRLGDVDFPHELHFDALEIECELCHHETRAAPLAIPHQEYFVDFRTRCAACHRESAPASAPLACSRCHHDFPTDVVDGTLSARVVIHRSCWQCHEVGTGVEASRSCITCHAAGLHSTPATADGRKEPRQ